MAEKEEQNLLVEDPPVTKWISTGCTLLDLAISNDLPGGFPIGRIVEVFGPPSSCKSVLGMLALGYCQRANGVGHFCDVEDTFLADWSKMYGLDPANKDTFRLTGGLESPETVEKLFDEYLNDIIKLKDNRFHFAVVDSLTALASETEKQTALDKASYGATKASRMSAAFRKYSPPVLSKSKVGILFLNQTRDNIGVMFGPTDVTSGGRALSFYASVRVRLTTGAKIENANKQIIGVWVHFEVVKNKLNAPFRKGSFKILFDYGLDDIFSNLNFLKEQQKNKSEEGEEKSDKKVSFNGELKTLSKMVDYVEENNLEKKLQEEVLRVWQAAYAPNTTRKRRNWNE